MALNDIQRFDGRGGLGGAVGQFGGDLVMFFFT
jgi:hypothetical protein